MTDTTAPRTAAGRALLAFENHIGGAGMKAERALDAALGADWKYGDAILAIEAEAIEPLLALVRAVAAENHRLGATRPGEQPSCHVCGGDWPCPEYTALSALPPEIITAARKP